MKNNPILLVAGEPNSIFFEILFKALRKKKYKSPLVLICCKKILMRHMKKLNYKKKLEILEVERIIKKKINNKCLNIIDINFKNTSNKKSLRIYLKKSFDVACDLMHKGFTNKLINGPINKKNFLNKKFLGITEYISYKFKRNKTGMLIYNKELSVCPLTTHLPLKQVANKVSKKLISEKIELIDSFFKKKLKIKAKIAVTGLNPHCESVSNFNEDEKIIPQVIKSKFKKNINVKGPYSADTIFLKKNRKKFNVILGMYHDQVLGPFKSLYEYNAINITMGLPILRLSPDHGPNIEMVGKNKSNPLSLIKALDFLDNR
ncbi:4-hydroxythreonine-4-phosphate dehydrogenase PdxA [Candidatus Pelagibacter communis]|uniref:4-hydroxythreonine-4-phosphate dehydrogenase PdxA n=1 Tax=Pelagibacter ubique TaxID=198252 RepID=UPI00094D7122|nr:4-hydroxythreonine-4-phosphate dehydrogenase PdxA [Candidatus Pelagibacter ubique]